MKKPAPRQDRRSHASRLRTIARDTLEVRTIRVHGMEDSAAEVTLEYYPTDRAVYVDLEGPGISGHTSIQVTHSDALEELGLRLLVAHDRAKRAGFLRALRGAK